MAIDDFSGIEPFEICSIRPPTKNNSLTFRLTRNCYWNRCGFCPVYKFGARFSKRALPEIQKDILGDADSLILKPEFLSTVIREINDRFPTIRRFTVYGRTATASRARSLPDLKQIKKTGLDRVHFGIESGSDDVLSLVQKGKTKEDHINGCLKTKEASLSCSVYVMP